MIKILFDITGWQVYPNRGIGNYIYWFVNSLAEERNVQLTLLYDNKIKFSASQQQLPTKVDLIYDKNQCLNIKFDCLLIGSLVNGKSRRWLEFMDICRTSIAIFYDLIPFIYSDRYLTNVEIRDEYIIDISCLRLIDKIYCISNSTLRDVHRILNIPYEKLSVINCGIPVVSEISSIKERKKEICMVSGNDPRKNSTRVSRAFCRAIDRGVISNEYTLRIICACDDEFRNRINRAVSEFSQDSQRKIVIENYVPEEKLKNYLQTARATIYASLYEGLGLPILESYANGTPCICSNNSSCCELNISEATFDPLDENDICDKLQKICHDDKIWEKNILAGRKLLKKFQWSEANCKLIRDIENCRKNARREYIIPVFSTTLPDRSGIAKSSEQLFGSREFILFTGQKTYRDRLINQKNKSSGISDNVYPMISFLDFSKYFEYKSKIFVLGNSFHNIPSLLAAMKYSSREDWIYLHDAQLEDLFASFGNYLGVGLNELENRFYHDIKESIYWLKPLIHLTKVRKFIVNTASAAEILRGECENEDLNIQTVFLPIIRERVDSRVNLKEKRIVVGTFGIPSDYCKGTIKIIEAIKKIRDMGINISLIMAGFAVDDYLKNKKIKYDWLMPFDAPEHDNFMKLINSVDIGIQLRDHSHGESSGCISQLLACQKKIVTTEGFAEYSKRLCNNIIFTVPPQSSADVLVRKILQILKEPRINAVGYEELFKYYSVQTLREKIIQFCNT